MNTETSAGGIVAYRDNHTWKILIMKDSKGVWTFPKGKVEENENLEQTAVREIAEEVGLTNLTLVAPLTPVMYWYFREKSIKKTVQYFLFRSKTKQKPVVQTEEGISDAKWVDLETAVTSVGYPKTNMPLLKEIMRKLTLLQ